MALDLSKIVQHNFSEKEYKRITFPKRQIVLHHTVSGDSVDGDISWWLNDKKRIGTCILIARDGTIHQVFSSKYWAYHLGENGRDHSKVGLRYRRNDMNSIGIEIDSWGGLVQDEESKLWYPAKWDVTLRRMIPNKNLDPIENVTQYQNGYRGFYGFESYTDEQIQAVKDLLEYWGEAYDIPLKYNEDMWDITSKALNGSAGVFSHVSYRSDKSDCHPQPELIKMLKSL